MWYAYGTGNTTVAFCQLINEHEIVISLLYGND